MISPFTPSEPTEVQNEINSLNQQKTEQTNFSGEYLAVLSLILLGLAGLFFSWSSNQCSPTANNFPVESKRNNYNKQKVNQHKIKEVVLKKTVSTPLLNQITIEGVNEANELLQFTIDNYHEDVIYELDFGENATIILEDKTIMRSYAESGLYLVELRGSFNGETKLLHSDWLEIIEPIEYDYDAIVEVSY